MPLWCLSQHLSLKWSQLSPSSDLSCPFARCKNLMAGNLVKNLNYIFVWTTHQWRPQHLLMWPMVFCKLQLKTSERTKSSTDRHYSLATHWRMAISHTEHMSAAREFIHSWCVRIHAPAIRTWTDFFSNSRSMLPMSPWRDMPTQREKEKLKWSQTQRFNLGCCILPRWALISVLRIWNCHLPFVVQTFASRRSICTCAAERNKMVEILFNEK